MHGEKRPLGPLPYVVAATFFMEYLDTTVIATALPQMAHAFATSPNALSLGMSAYMIALAIFIPASGWVADRFGSRSVFFSAIVTFTVASLLCGLSQDVVQFTAARVLQGIGGALMVPVGRLIVVRSTDKGQLMQAISTITWPGIVAPVVGPPLGGFITTYASWRWIFLLNLPVCLAVLCAVAAWVPNLRGDERKPLDVLGLVLSGLTLTAILYGADLASQPHTNPLVGLSIVAGGVLCGVVAYRHARVHRHPLIDITTLRIPTFSVTVVTGSLTQQEIMRVPMSWLPGDQFFANMQTVLSNANFGQLLLNSFIIATGITVGKLAVSVIAAFAVTYFRFPFRMTAFWLIFMSLMLPIEVRIVPTYESAANVALPLNILGSWFGVQALVDLDWNLVNTYSGLILPLIASATATFLFRQFFLTVPDELCEAARIDGATPWQFFRLILLPLSRSNIVALAIILFLMGWNQYLWPLLLTTEPAMANAVIGLKKLMPQSDSLPTWHLLMNAAFLTMLPPTLVILILQRWFVKGLVDSGK